MKKIKNYFLLINVIKHFVSYKQNIITEIYSDLRTRNFFVLKAGIHCHNGVSTQQTAYLKKKYKVLFDWTENHFISFKV